MLMMMRRMGRVVNLRDDGRGRIGVCCHSILNGKRWEAQKNKEEKECCG